MDVRAVSTRWKLLAGFCAATLALTGCDDSSSDKKEADAGDAGGGGNGNGNGNGNANNGGDMDGGDTGGMMGMPVAMLGDNVAGKACTGNTDCEGENATCASMIGGISILGMTIGGQTAEGGYCTGACEDDSNCGAGGVCVGALNVMGFATQGTCQKACESDTDCRTDQGYACSDNNVQLPEGGIPGQDGGAGGGMMLPPQPSTCLPVPETVDLDDGVVGKACAADADCAGGTCTMMIMQGGFGGMGGMTVEFPGGYCGGKCLEDEQCGTGGVCIGAFSGFGIMNPGECYQGCEEQTDCTRDGYTCAAQGGFMGMGGGPSACQPGEDPAPSDGGVGDAGADAAPAAPATN